MQEKQLNNKNVNNNDKKHKQCIGGKTYIYIYIYIYILYIYIYIYTNKQTNKQQKHTKTTNITKQQK